MLNLPIYNISNKLTDNTLTWHSFNADSTKHLSASYCKLINKNRKPAWLYHTDLQFPVYASFSFLFYN